MRGEVNDITATLEKKTVLIPLTLTNLHWLFEAFVLKNFLLYDL